MKNETELAGTLAEAPTAGSDGWAEAEPGLLFKNVVSSDQTNGAYSVVEAVAQPGVGSTFHNHHKESEQFLVLEGTVHVVLDGKGMDLGAGDTASLPRAVPHLWINRSDKPVRMLTSFIPGGFEKLPLEMAAGKMNPSQLLPKYGLEILGPKMDVTKVL